MWNDDQYGWYHFLDTGYDASRSTYPCPAPSGQMSSERKRQMAFSIVTRILNLQTPWKGLRDPRSIQTTLWVGLLQCTRSSSTAGVENSCSRISRPLFFFSQRLAPELTSVANFFFLFLPKAPQYIVVYSSCRSFWFCYVGRHLSMAWLAVLALCPGSEIAKPWAAKVEHENLNTWAGGQPCLTLSFLMFIF